MWIHPQYSHPLWINDDPCQTLRANHLAIVGPNDSNSQERRDAIPHVSPEKPPGLFASIRAYSRLFMPIRFEPGLFVCVRAPHPHGIVISYVSRYEKGTGAVTSIPFTIGIFLCELIAHRLARLAAYKFNQQ
jgi:hypothetical protein